MFTTPCFIRKNTPELRKKLEDIGYRDFLTAINEPCLQVWDEDDRGPCFTSESLKEMRRQDHIDCGTNEELFLALAVLRDDINKQQWFVAHCPLLFDKLKNTVKTEDNRRYVSAGGWFNLISERAEFKWMALSRPESLYHKATSAEIIKHFKNKP